jgi:hypothetical protein
MGRTRAPFILWAHHFPQYRMLQSDPRFAATYAKWILLKSMSEVDLEISVFFIASQRQCQMSE